MDSWGRKSSVHTILKKWTRSSLSLTPDVLSSWPWGGPSQPGVCVDDGKFPDPQPSILSRSSWFRAWRSNPVGCDQTQTGNVPAGPQSRPALVHCLSI